MEKTLVRKNGRVWSDSSRLQLLAYLNWCATYRENFLLTAADHLKRVTGNDFTQTQIRRKLRLEWKNQGLCDKFDDVFTHGTPSLDLSDQEQNEIQLIFTGLLHSPHELRSNRWETRTRSRAAPKIVKTLKAKSPVVKLKVTNENSPISPEASPHFLDYGVNGDGDKENAVNLIEVPNTDSEVGELSSSCPSFRSALQSPSRISSPGPTGQPSDDVAALRNEVLKLKGHNLALQNRVSELKADSAEIRHLRESTEGDIDYCTLMVYHLEKRLKAISTRSNDIEASRAGSRGLPESTIMQKYRDLYLSILSESHAFCGDYDSPRISNNDENAHPARGWAMKASGWDLYPLLCHYNNETIPSSRLVAALVAAGIFDLVFERVFPDILSIECPLINGYRRHILTKDGSEALRLADLAAMESLRLSEDKIKEPMIEEKAKHLSEFILQSLSFCITAESHELTAAGDDPDMEEALPDLDIPLSQALDLKLSLTISMMRFKFFFFWPGHDFDQRMMEKDDMSNNDCVVKLCLLPALFSVPSDRFDTRLDEYRWEIDYLNDRYLTEAREEEAASLRLVAKAIVLT